MIKRAINRGLWLLCTLWMMTAFAESAPSQFELGKQYARFPLSVMENPQVEELKKELKPGQIKVIEFFSYGCVWCFRLDPHVESWLKEKPDYIAFERIPIIFHPSWKLFTKAYYTAEALQDLEKIHAPFFKAVHEEGLAASVETIKNFFVEKGISAKQFDEAFDSFSVERQLKEAESMARVFKIRRIPSMVILTPDAGYFATVSMAGGPEGLLQLVDELAKTAHDKAEAPAS